MGIFSALLGYIKTRREWRRREREYFASRPDGPQGRDRVSAIRAGLAQFLEPSQEQRCDYSRN